MEQYVVVDDPSRWPMDPGGARTVAALDYLSDPAFSELRRARVYNLCRSKSYQSTGYYVSLLAEARGHRPLPSVTTLRDLRSLSLRQAISEDIVNLLQRALVEEAASEARIPIYFGRTPASEHARIAAAIFGLFPAPMLALEAKRDASGWKIQRLAALPAIELGEGELRFAVASAERYFQRPRIPRSVGQESRFELAILVDPAEPDPPSDAAAISRFLRAAKQLQIGAEVIGRDDYSRIGEYDALLLRTTTSVEHYTYRFARRAEVEDIPVIDSSQAILRCGNKVFLAETFARHKIEAPKTLVVHPGNLEEVADTLGFPMVVKAPDSAFSAGVYKIADRDTLHSKLPKMLADSTLLVAQEWMPSDFDWRIGVLSGAPLFVCRYYMARGHWQVQRALDGTRRQYGRTETLALEDAPAAAVDLAVRAASLMGEGLFGVDIKERDGQFFVIEVNDNPNIEAGVEDAVLKDELYLAVVGNLLRRVEKRAAMRRDS